MSELAATPAVAVLAEESGAAAFRLDGTRPVTGWGVLSGAQIWIWAMGLRTLQPGAAEDPFTYEAWVADRAGMLRSLGALGPAPGGVALATFRLDGDPAAAAGLVVTAQARGATRPTAVLLTGRVQRAEPAAVAAAAPETWPEPAVEPVSGGAGAAGAGTGLTDRAEEPGAEPPAGAAPDAAPSSAPAAFAAPAPAAVSPPAAFAAPATAAASPPAAFAAPLAGSGQPDSGLTDSFGTAPGPGAHEAASQPWPAWPGAPAPGAAPLLRPLSGGSPGSAPPEPLAVDAPPGSGLHIPRDPTGAAMYGYPHWDRPLRPMGTETATGTDPGTAGDAFSGPASGGAPAADPAPVFPPGPAGRSFMPGAAPADLPAAAPDPVDTTPAGVMPGAAAAPATAGDLPLCPPGHVPVERAAVALEPQGPLYGQGSGSAQLDFADGGLLVTLRGMPPADAMGQSGHTGRPYNAYRVWLQAGGTRQILPVGMVSRVWTDTWRLQVRDGLPLRRFDTVLVTAEDRAGSSAFPAGPVLLVGHYRWYRPGP